MSSVRPAQESTRPRRATSSSRRSHPATDLWRKGEDAQSGASVGPTCHAGSIFEMSHAAWASGTIARSGHPFGGPGNQYAGVIVHTASFFGGTQGRTFWYAVSVITMSGGQRAGQQNGPDGRGFFQLKGQSDARTDQKPSRVPDNRLRRRRRVDPGGIRRGWPGPCRRKQRETRHGWGNAGAQDAAPLPALRTPVLRRRREAGAP